LIKPGSKMGGGPRVKEISGAQPGSFALMARRPAACAMAAKMKAQNEQAKILEERAAGKKLQAYEDLRVEFEDNLNRKLFSKNIMRKVNKLRMGDMIDLEIRREKLRNMLSQEEEELVREMDQGRETYLERQAKIRARARELRQKREQERLNVVTDKYEQQFRRNSDEIRGALRQKFTVSNAEDNLKLIERKGERQQEEDRREQMWAEQWENDRLAKEAREQHEEAVKEGKQKAWAEEVRNEITAHAKKKEEERQIEEEEGRLLQEQEELMKLEQMAERLVNAKKAADYRKELGLTIKMAARRRLQKQQEELQMDMDMIEKLQGEWDREKQQMGEDKIRLKKELENYLEYLRQCKEQAKIDDCMVEALADAEVERALRKREEEWERERLRKCKMLKDAVDSWNKTISERLENNKVLQAQKAADRKAYNAAVEKALEDEKKKVAEIRHRDECHAHDVLQQIDYNKELARVRKRNEARMYKAGLEQEKEYQERIKYALEHPDINTFHPVRVKAFREGTLENTFVVQ